MAYSRLNKVLAISSHTEAVQMPPSPFYLMPFYLLCVTLFNHSLLCILLPMLFCYVETKAARRFEKWRNYFGFWYY